MRYYQFTLATVAAIALGADAFGNGLVRDGFTARTQALGGAATATAQSPLEAMTSNPAALTEIENPTAEISVDGVFVRGSFQKAGEKTSHLRNRINFLGDVAIAFPTGNRAIHWGLSATPTYAGKAEWRFRDVEGGLDGKTSYGVQRNASEFLVYSLQAGVGVDLASWLSVGAAAGLLYNTNSLHVPYTFQDQAVLKGAKTNLDLQSDGFGVAGQFGFTVKPTKTLKISAVYTTPSEIHARGHVNADLSSQFRSLGGTFTNLDPKLRADGEVINHLPQKISVGIAWQPEKHWLFTTQLDWINWASAFDDLQINLRNVSNPTVNSLVGSNQLTDYVPLHWRDQTILRFGAEYSLSDEWKLRIGYSHSSHVVPSETFSPLNGPIAEHLITAGIGYEQPLWHLDFSYQWNLPTDENVAISSLRSGEYGNSRTTLETHWIGLTYGFDF